MFVITPLLYHPFLKDRFARAAFISGVVLNIVLGAVLGFAALRFPATASLHYTIYFGIDLIGPWYHIFILPLIGFVITIVNGAGAFGVYQTEKLLSYFLLMGSVAVAVVMFMAAVVIMFINL